MNFCPWECGQRLPGAHVNRQPPGPRLFLLFHTEKPRSGREGGSPKVMAVVHSPARLKPQSGGLRLGLSHFANSRTEPCTPLFFGRGGDLSYPYRVVGSQEWKWRGEKDVSILRDPFLPETRSCLGKEVRGRGPLTCWGFRGSPI